MASVRFGLFQFDRSTGELFREGTPVQLQSQPTKVLSLLVASNGELVTREALRDALWNDGTSVDFDRGLNFAIAQVRSALRDSADSPTFIQTVPKRGYRFLAPVVPLATLPAQPSEHRRFPRWLALSIVVTLTAAAAAMVGGAFRTPPATQPRIAIARFQNETGDPAFDRFAGSVTDSLVASLTSHAGDLYGIIGNAPVLCRARGF